MITPAVELTPAARKYRDDLADQKTAVRYAWQTGTLRQLTKETSRALRRYLNATEDYSKAYALELLRDAIAEQDAAVEGFEAAR